MDEHAIDLEALKEIEPDIYASLTRENKYGLDEYVIRDGKKHPFALICPGGGYEMVADFVEGKPFAEELNKRGYSAFVVYYRVRDLAHYPAPQEDVARALKDILSRADELDLDTECWSLWGSSAGGHLAASFATKNMGYEQFGLPKPGTMVLIYPVITMGEYTHEGSRSNLIGSDAADEQIAFASVESNVTSDYPPTFVWCGDADDVVPMCNSEMLAAALEREGVPHLLKVYPGIGHGVGLGKGTVCEEWLDEAVKFWEKQRGAADK